MRALFCVIVAALLVAGCSRQAQRSDKADIDKAIRQHIAAKPGLAGGGMSVHVKQVEFKGDKAEADVQFQARSNPEASMVMRYTLKRTGPGTWAVESGKSAASAQPQGHAPMGGEAPPQGMRGGGMASPHGMPPAQPAHPPAAGKQVPESTPKR
jgi:hypothetical protein